MQTMKLIAKAVARILGAWVCLPISAVLTLAAPAYFMLGYGVLHNRGESAHVPYDGLGRTLVWEDGMEEAFFSSLDLPQDEQVSFRDAIRHTWGQRIFDAAVVTALLVGGAFLGSVGWNLLSRTGSQDPGGYFSPSSPLSRKETYAPSPTTTWFRTRIPTRSTILCQKLPGFGRA